MGTTPVEVLGHTVEYLGTAFVPQVIHQTIANALSRGDLAKAITAKCGDAGASNYSDLERQVLSPNPMRPSISVPISFRNIFRPSGWRQIHTGIPNSGYDWVRFPWLGQFRMLPIIRNPYLLFTGGMYEWGHRLDHKEEGGAKWAGIALGASILLADAGRGFRFMNFGPFSRVAGIQIPNPNFDPSQRFSQRFQHLTYNDYFRRVVGNEGSNIECNKKPPEGGLPEVVADEAPASAPEAAAAEAPASVPEAVAAGDTAESPAASPENTRLNLARRSLEVYAGGATQNPLQESFFAKYFQNQAMISPVITPVTMPLSMPTLSLSIFSWLRPVVLAR